MFSMKSASFFLFQDYHVLLLRQVDAKCLIYDLDSILPFPCPFEQYVQQAIQNDRQLKKHFHRYSLLCCCML